MHVLETAQPRVKLKTNVIQKSTKPPLARFNAVLILISKTPSFYPLGAVYMKQKNGSEIPCKRAKIQTARGLQQANIQNNLSPPPPGLRKEICIFFPHKNNGSGQRER